MKDLDIWTFLNKFYHDEIDDLGLNWPDKSSLIIDLLDVQKYDIEYYESFLSHPDKNISEIERVLSEWDFPFETLNNFNPIIRLKSHSIPVRIRDIRHTHIGQLVTVRGIVQKATEVTS